MEDFVLGAALVGAAILSGASNDVWDDDTGKRFCTERDHLIKRAEGEVDRLVSIYQEATQNTEAEMRDLLWSLEKDLEPLRNRASAIDAKLRAI